MAKDAGSDGGAQAEGGRARARALSRDKRSNIARRAALARWGSGGKVKQAICGSPEHPLTIGGMEIPCYVLEDGRRVLAQVGIQTAVGFSRSAAKRGSRRLAHFLEGLEKKGMDIKGLSARAAEPIEFVPPHGGIRALGYEATILPDFCRVVLEARREGFLLRQQERVAAQCEILLAGLANIGIIALVDEATGYQDMRARDALAQILEKFIAKELQPWVHTFPADFYKELFRVRGLKWPGDGVSKRPKYFGHLTNDIIYKRLAPGVLDELRRDTPKTAGGNRKHKYFQKLTPDIGHPKLRDLVTAATTLMKITDDEDYDGFLRLLDKTHPRYDRPLSLGLNDPNEDDAD